jgi:hypothetical protein
MRHRFRTRVLDACGARPGGGVEAVAETTVSATPATREAARRATRASGAGLPRVRRRRGRPRRPWPSSASRTRRPRPRRRPRAARARSAAGQRSPSCWPGGAPGPALSLPDARAGDVWEGLDDFVHAVILRAVGAAPGQVPNPGRPPEYYRVMAGGLTSAVGWRPRVSGPAALGPRGWSSPPPSGCR